ncbi:major capsid protein [Tortoise microvirus 85]|nr:major capsid protein [Tortoise microvirus 85]
MIKNLGGDRLGSGAKMNQELHGWSRSTHDLTTDIATTMSIGTLLPIHHSVILAGDTREIDLDAMLLTHPTEGPLFGSFKLQVDVFKADMRLYIAKLHMNLLEKGLTMSDIKLPLIEMDANNIDWTKDPNNQQINPSCIFKYLHISGLGYNDSFEAPRRYFNAIPWLMYWDIYKNYYANKQETYGWVIHTGIGLNETITAIKIKTGSGAESTIVEAPATGLYPVTGFTKITIEYDGAQPLLSTVMVNTTNGQQQLDQLFTQITYENDDKIILEIPNSNFNITNWLYVENGVPITTVPRLEKFPLTNLDEIKMDILADIKSTSAFTIKYDDHIAPFSYALELTNGIYSKMYSQEGLAIKTYQSDLFNNWLNTEYIDGVNGINARTAIQVDVNGKFTIDNFLLKEKLYDHLNRIAIAGGTVDDMMEVTYDVSNRTRSEIPTFEGGMSKELVFEQVISNTATSTQPLGTIAGRGTTQGHKGGKIRITNDDTQHAYYMVIASLTPRIKYSQGNGWDTNIKTYDDLHKPAFDQIGFQDLITDQMAFWDTYCVSGGIAPPVFKSAGKQPAWINYQTEIDRVFGNFAIQSAEGWMVLDRNYDWDAENHTIKDLTTYIDPEKYNGVFAYRALDAQNIWAQFKVRDKAIRKMSANQIPRM